MKKFRFTLHSVAIQRQLREGDRRERFAVAARAHAAAVAARELVEARIVELEAVIAAERAGRFQAAAQIGFMQALVAEGAKRAEAGRAVAQCQTALDAARQAWIDSRRDVRLIETLETKARAAHRLAGEREEQALLDDRTNALCARAG